MKDNQQVPAKRVPQRTCVVCRTKTAKRELVRLVCAAGGVEVDTTGKKPGRGAYLCTKLECWGAALKNGRLEYALRTKISQENRDQLVTYAKGLDKEGAS